MYQYLIIKKTLFCDKRFIHNEMFQAKRIKILPYFWSTKSTQFLSSCVMKRKRTLLNMSFPIPKIWHISISHFIKHKPLISQK